MSYEEIRYENTFQDKNVDENGEILDIGAGDKKILVVNRGADAVYVREGFAASAEEPVKAWHGSMKVASGASLTILVTSERLGLICAEDETATVTVGKEVPRWHTVQP